MLCTVNLVSLNHDETLLIYCLFLMLLTSLIGNYEHAYDMAMTLSAYARTICGPFVFNSSGC